MALDVIKLLRNLFAVLKMGLNFRVFLRFKPRGIKSREKGVKLILFFQDDKTSAPRPHFETSLVMVSYYGYEI